MPKGFKVLRLWECEINKMNINKFNDKINDHSGEISEIQMARNERKQLNKLFA